MKVLIWLGCFFVATILNAVLGYATGFKAGYLIFYFVVYFSAKSLCNKWDEYRYANTKQKEAIKQKNTDAEEKAVIEEAAQIYFCRECGAKLLVGSQFCRKCGIKVTFNGESLENKNMFVQTKKEAECETTHKWRCNECGKMRTQSPCEYCGKE